MASQLDSRVCGFFCDICCLHSLALYSLAYNKLPALVLVLFFTHPQPTAYSNS